MSYVASYVVIWWLLFFIALPISISEEEISNEHIYKKEVTNIRLVKKIAIVTIIAIPIAYGLVHYFDQFLLNQISTIIQ